MIATRTYKIIIISIVTFLAILSIVILIRHFNQTPTPINNINSEMSTEHIKSSILAGLDSHNFKHTGDITIDNVQYFQEKWVIVTATLPNEPLDSEARQMVYVLQKDDTLTLIAFSGDGFSEDSFPSGTPVEIKNELMASQP